MKLLIICCLFATLSRETRALAMKRASKRNLEQLNGKMPNIFNQTLDHLSNSTAKYWNQRYYVNTIFWKKKKNSPVFLEMGGESEVGSDWQYGSWVEWGNKYGALLFTLEHRFYGQSYPTEDASVENLQYLRSQQALGDLKNFIEQMKLTYNLTNDNKWIIFGGSYSGALTAWSRLKLPDLVYGAVASSGPLEAKVDLSEYQDVVRYALDANSPGCSDQLTKAYKSIQDMLKTPTGTKTVINKFNVCGGFDSKNIRDVYEFFKTLTGPISSSVQYNNIGKPDQTIFSICSFMTNQTVPDPVDRLVQVYKNHSKGCLDGSYMRTITRLRASSWNDPAQKHNERQWFFQTCNELGFFHTSPLKSSLESDTLPVDYYIQKCTDSFGSNYNASQLNSAVSYTNQYYHGKNISVDRVVFVQGSGDPWHPPGMINNPTAESPLIYINGTAHCQDTQEADDSDSPALKAARKKIQDYLDYWLLA